MKAGVAALAVEREMDPGAALDLEQPGVAFADDRDDGVGRRRVPNHRGDTAAEFLVLLGPDAARW